MTNRYILSLAGLTVLNVFLYATGWELLIRDLVEPLFGIDANREQAVQASRWGYIVTATVFTALAIIGPFLLFDVGGIIAIVGLALKLVVSVIRDTRALYFAERLP